jgi:hypothetical protein
MQSCFAKKVGVAKAGQHHATAESFKICLAEIPVKVGTDVLLHHTHGVWLLFSPPIRHKGMSGNVNWASLDNLETKPIQTVPY